MKNYPTHIKEALRNKDGHTFQHVITIFLDGQNLRMTDSAFDIVYLGETYLANRLIESIDSVEQEEELTAQELEISFTGVDQTMLALFLNNEQRGRRVVVSRVLMTGDTFLAYNTPLLTNNYRIASFSTNGETIAVSLRGALTDLFQIKGVVTTMESLRRYYPDTTSFINSANVSEKLKWGG
jgi:hypothetical protein